MASFLWDIRSKIVILFRQKYNSSFMLCANLLCADTVTYILTHLNKYLKCALDYDTLIIQIDAL